jgi:hypothetical protein
LFDVLVVEGTGADQDRTTNEMSIASNAHSAVAMIPHGFGAAALRCGGFIAFSELRYQLLPAA